MAGSNVENKYYVAKQRADKEAARKVQDYLHRCRNMQIRDLPKFRLSINAKGKDLREFLGRRHVRYEEMAAMVFEGFEALGADYVVVTQPFLVAKGEVEEGKENEWKLGSFHLVELFDDENLAGPVIQLVIKENDNYYCGWRLVEADNADEPGGWVLFKDVKLLPSYFGGFTFMPYGSGYRNVGDVVEIGDGVLPNIYKFLSNRAINHRIFSKKGNKYHQTLMIFTGECQRLRAAERFVVVHFNDLMLVKLEPALVFLIKNWSSLSKTGFLWLLSDLENQQNIQGHDVTFNVAKDRLEAAEEKYGKIVNFRDAHYKFKLHRLLGGVLMLLKHDPVLVSWLLMRKEGYREQFPLKYVAMLKAQDHDVLKAGAGGR